MIKFNSQIDYNSVYTSLAGGSLPFKLYKRAPRVRGYGLFGLARRFAFPIFKYLGKQALPALGEDLLSDLMPGIKSAKENLKKRAISALHSLGDKIQSRVGIRQKGGRRHRTRKVKQIKRAKPSSSRRNSARKTKPKIVGRGRKHKSTKTKSKRVKKTRSKRRAKKIIFNDIFK